jgi:hypothetical protein
MAMGYPNRETDDEEKATATVVPQPPDADAIATAIASYNYSFAHEEYDTDNWYDSCGQVRNLGVLEGLIPLLSIFAASNVHYAAIRNKWSALWTNYIPVLLAVAALAGQWGRWLSYLWRNRNLRLWAEEKRQAGRGDEVPKMVMVFVGGGKGEDELRESGSRDECGYEKYCDT